MSRLFIKNPLLILCACGVLVFGGSIIFAAPPDSPYLPGQTLDPDCAPGDSNCSVAVTQDLSSRDTDDLDEGSINLYYSEGRVSNNSDVSANTLLRHSPVTLAGSNYLSLTNQIITAGTIDISEHTNLSVGSGLVLTDNSLSVSGLSTGNFTSQNISQWTNDSGYLTTYTETDPVFTASAASGISGGNITNWNTAFSWGNHALEGYYGSGTKPFLKAISSTEENFGSTTAGGPGNAALSTPQRIWLESNQNTTLGLVGIRAETGHFDSQGSRTYRLRIYDSSGAGDIGTLLYEESFARSFPVGWDVREIDLPLTTPLAISVNDIFVIEVVITNPTSQNPDSWTSLVLTPQLGAYADAIDFGGTPINWFIGFGAAEKGVIGPLDEADLPGYGLSTVGQVLARTASGAEFINISTGNFASSNISQWTNDANYISDLSTFDATDLSIIDSNSYFTATTVEAALAELFASDSNAFSLLNKPRLSGIDAAVVESDRTNSWDALDLNTYLVARINAVENTPFSTAQVKVRAQGANSTQLTLKIYEADEAWVQGDLLVDVDSDIYDGSLVDPYWATFDFPEITPVTGANYIFRVDTGPNWSYTYFLPYRSTSSATGNNNVLMGDYNIIQMSMWLNGTSEAGYAWGLRLGTSALPKGVVGPLDPADFPGFSLSTEGQVLARTADGLGFVDQSLGIVAEVAYIDGEEERRTGTSTTSSSYSGSYGQLQALQNFDLGKVTFESNIGGVHTLEIQSSTGLETYRTATASGGPGWITFELDEALSLTAGTTYRFRFTPPSNTNIRYSSSSHSGSLWSMSSIHFVGYGDFGGSLSMGLIPRVPGGQIPISVLSANSTISFSELNGTLTIGVNPVETTYLDLADTPDTFTSNAIPFINSLGGALLHSPGLTFNENKLSVLGIPNGVTVSEGIMYLNAPQLTEDSVVAWEAEPTWDLGSIGSGSHPALVDLDGDGDYDLMTGGGNVVAYENTGTNSSPVWTRNASWDIPDTGYLEDAPAFADIDNDGDYDVYIGHGDNNSIRAYENTGTSASPVWTRRAGWDVPGSNSTNYAKYTRPTLADLDNDGDFDLMYGRSDGAILTYENTGTTSSPVWTIRNEWSPPNVGGQSSPFLYDLDNDGDFDVLIGIGGTAAQAYAFENTGTITYPAWTAKPEWDTPSPGNNPVAPVVADLDNDGDGDLLLGLYDGSTRGYRNIGALGSGENNTLFGVAVGGNERFRINGSGDILAAGSLSVTSGGTFGSSLTFSGFTGEAVSNSGQGRIYFDSAENKFKVSENNGTYVDLVGGGASTYLALTDTPLSFTANAIPYTNSAGDALLHSADFIYDGAGALGVNGTQALYIPGGDFTGTLIVGDGGQNLTHSSLDDGRYNTFVGLGAGIANTIGYNNTASGYLALNANTTGSLNTASGYQALYSNTTGYANVASGGAALYNNTSGTNNAAVGNAALYFNTEGYGNAAFGNSALYKNTTGYFNAASGYDALEYNTTGSYNTAIGHQAGSLAGPGVIGFIPSPVENETSSYSVYLGYDSRAGADGNTNEIVIGSEALGSGSNTVTLGNDSIVTTALKGNVGIGTTLPSKTLDIVGSGINLENTTSDATGIVWKDDNRFLHNFQHPTGSTAVPLGRNTFVGLNSGNFTMGSTATVSQHGSNNTGVGEGTLVSNTVGFNNTAIGSWALLNNTTGDRNTATGHEVLRLNTTGHRNTATGNYALHMNTTGFSNTATGYEALRGNSTGYNNTAFGYLAGRYAADGVTENQTSYNSLYLGFETRAGSSGNTNEVVIGFQAIGRGSNTVTLGDNSITDTFLQGNVSVGPTTPSYKLHVSVSGSGSVAGFTNTNGTCTIDPNTTSLSCSSDERLKVDTRELSIHESSLSRLSQLNPVSYRWINEEGTNAPLRYGLIAQDVQKIFPELVGEGPLLDPNNPELGSSLTIAYGGFTPFMIDAIKELNEKVDFLSTLPALSDSFPSREGGSLSDIIVNAVKNSIVTAQEFIAKRIQTEKLCIGETCVTEKELIDLLRNSGVEPYTETGSQDVVGPTKEKEETLEEVTEEVASETLREEEEQTSADIETEGVIEDIKPEAEEIEETEENMEVVEEKPLLTEEEVAL